MEANTLSVERSIWINAPIQRVWEAITQVEQLRQWWGGDYWEISALEVGATIKFGDPNDLMLAEVAVAEPPHQFSIHWPPQPQYHQLNMVTHYMLSEENGGTRVTVTETGYEALPDDIRQQRYDSSTKGYTTVLASLKTYVEGGSLPH